MITLRCIRCKHVGERCPQQKTIENASFKVFLYTSKMFSQLLRLFDRLLHNYLMEIKTKHRAKLFKYHKAECKETLRALLDSCRESSLGCWRNSVPRWS